MTEHKTIWAALAAAQAEFKPLRKSGRNPHFRTDYSTMGDILDATRDSLTKHGIAIYQAPTMLNETTVVISRLSLANGDSVQDMLALSPVNDMQKLGAAITYARRYLLASQLCLAAGEDDDAESITPHQNSAKPQQEEKPKSKLNMTEDERAVLKGWYIEDPKMPERAAKKWSIKVGACDNDYNAKAALASIIREHGGMTEGNKPAVLLDFYRNRMLKLANQEPQLQTEGEE